MTACPCEETPQHAHSPGLVEDPEGLCRGAFDPVHFNTSGIKVAFVRPQQLLEGELSVWRYERTAEFGVNEARVEIEASKAPGHILNRILAARTDAIRKFEVRMGEGVPARRAFCVVDDCTTTLEGDWHPEHAVLRMAKHEGFEWTADGDEFTVAKEGLLAIFKQNEVWKAPPPEGAALQT